MATYKFATRWCDDDSEELPTIPWTVLDGNNKTKKKWGALDRSELDPVRFLKPLDDAGEYYLNRLWAQNVSACIVKSIEDYLLRSELEPLDRATQIYLDHYWKDLVREAKSATK